MFGINSGCAIFTAQFWGKKDIANIRRVLGLALVSGGSLSLLFASAAFFIPQYILRLFTMDLVVIDLGSQYLKTISFSYLITTISFGYAFASRSIGQAKLPMVVSAISLLTNTLLNYLLIFGNFGFPAMGVRGAALATVIARSVELIFLLSVIYKQGDILAAKVHELLDFDFDFAKRIYQTAIPVVLNEGIWAMGMTMYAVAYARISTDAVASIQIANTIQNIFMVVAMGLGNSCAVMLGNEIGAGHKEKAITYGNTFILLGTLLGAVIGGLLVLVSPLILQFFNVSQSVYESAYWILMVMGFTMAIRIFNTILIIGIFRSGGDTKFSLYLEMGSVWIVGVPLAFIGALVWHLPVYWVYGLISIEELLKAVLGFPRVLSKKWVRNVVDHM
jgi:putative MATE family efflux protein